MSALTLTRVPVAGVPTTVTLEVGRQYVALVRDLAEARQLADLIAGLVDTPADAAVVRNGLVRLVPCQGGLLPHLTVLQNLVRAQRVARRRVPRATAAVAGRSMAHQCGLDDVVARYPYEITPGRRRLAGAARALCAKPAAIVLEDAPGLPTWGALLKLEHNPELLGTALLLITTDRQRAGGFAGVIGA